MQPIYLLDTNILSEITKPKPNKNVVKKVIENKHISTIASVTFEEMQEKYYPLGIDKDNVSPGLTVKS